MTYEPTQEEIDQAVNDVWDSYFLLRESQEIADDRHRAKVAEDAYWSYSLLMKAPEQCNEATRAKAKEWENGR